MHLHTCLCAQVFQSDTPGVLVVLQEVGCFEEVLAIVSIVCIVCLMVLEVWHRGKKIGESESTAA